MVYASLIVIITSYYYEMGLTQLNFKINLLLKSKKLIQINKRINKLLFEYVEIITGINQFNKFV